ncbi:MAG: LLM class flavin-dependent oxidoreductase [Caldilineaceae bacterium]|nr:LLM class flavin-dependent oxidoreductase [Caldilineaceae bacterium]
MTNPTISIAFQTDKPLSAYGPLAATAERYGFDGVTVYNDMLYQPAWLPLAEIAKATQRVRIGVAAVNPFTCHPVNIAGNIALIDEAAQGRAYLGLARGSWLDFVGIEAARPVTALREALGCIRHLLRQSREPYPGEIFPLAGGDSLRWSILRPELPFLLGTWGAATIRACAGLIDELKIGGSANPAVLPHFRQLLTKAAPTRPVDLAIGAVCVVDEDGQAARQYAKREVALYLPVVAALDPTLELDLELLQGLREAAARYDFSGAAALISDELLGRFAFAGTPSEVAEHAHQLFAAGADRVEFGTPHGLTPETGLRLLGEKVLPALHTG